MFNVFKPVLLTTTQSLYCPLCKEVFHDNLGERIESFPFPLKIDVVSLRKKLGSDRENVPVQKLWDLEARTVTRDSNHIHKDCKMVQRGNQVMKMRVEETFIQEPRKGIIISIGKQPMYKRISILVEDELKIKNEKPEAMGEFTTYQLVCGIQVECHEDLLDEDLEDLQLCLGEDPDKVPDSYSQFTLHFKKGEKYFKIYQNDKLGSSSKEEMSKCTLLFYKTKTPEDMTRSPQKTKEAHQYQ